MRHISSSFLAPCASLLKVDCRAAKAARNDAGEAMDRNPRHREAKGRGDPAFLPSDFRLLTSDNRIAVCNQSSGKCVSQNIDFTFFKTQQRKTILCSQPCGEHKDAHK